MITLSANQLQAILIENVEPLGLSAEQPNFMLFIVCYIAFNLFALPIRDLQQRTDIIKMNRNTDNIYTVGKILFWRDE